MRDITKEKDDLAKILDSSFEKLNQNLPTSYKLKSLKELQVDLENDFYTVVVVGEFKRGKSTFINALLEDEILPVDVTPTTATINAIMWNDEKKLAVKKNDGTVENLELNKKNLDRYIANNLTNHNEVNYLQLGMPADILKDNVVLIDTPGVDDLNQQRVEVTYNFIPRADAIIFLLDITNAVKQTEREFLENYIINEGIEKIIFVANFIDKIDEEEDDLDEILDQISNKLSNILENSNINLLSVSAKEGLEGILENDEEKLEFSGIIEVKEKVRETIDKSLEQNEKMDRYKIRTKNILNSVKREIQTVISLEKKNVAVLNNELSAINQLIKDKQSLKSQISQYVKKQEEEMILIINKSINFFISELQKDIEHGIDTYKGVDFKDYIEKSITRNVEKNVQSWIRNNTNHINYMFKMLEKELTTGMSTHFNTRLVNLNTTYGDINKSDASDLYIEADDISNITALTGVAAAGSAIVLNLLGGGLLFPLITMAGMPIFGNKLKDKKLEEAKIKLRPQFESAINEIRNSIKNTMHSYVIENCNKIQSSCENRYDEILKAMKSNFEKEINNKENLQNESETKTKDLEDTLKLIDKNIILVEE